ncbi:MAG TPA: DUF692 domain-containing protein [Burkholderiales bacterium]|nr:DUF692 domain-containing protein [Burkholderiales bacterium]
MSGSPAHDSNGIASATGVGLRACHYRDFLDGHPRTGWLEVHSENYFGDGGYDLHVLDCVRERYSVSLHGVALSLGSADGIRAAHLAKLKRLASRIEPVLVSEHLCWGAIGPRHFNDLLPMPFTRVALNAMVSHVAEVQEALGRRILVENVSSYVQFRNADMTEFGFLVELAYRSGCGILLDVNNLYVNSVNHGFDADEVLVEVPAALVGEIHLAGHSKGDDVLIDDHGSAVPPAVWKLYERACQRFGPVPTLVEWDTDIPSIEVLLGEADKAAQVMAVAHA